MEKEFIVVKAYFDDDIRFPYREKIIDITGIDPTTDDLDIILDNIIKDLQDSKVNHGDFNVYFPYGIGCGLAGESWSAVSSLTEKYFPNAIIVKYE